MKRATLLGARGAVVAALVALAASCTNSRTQGEAASAVPLPDDLPACSELFQEGKTIDEAEFVKACKTVDEEIAVPRPVKLTCHDDSKLLWNDYAWGYVGQPMQLFDANATVKMPTEEALECRREVDEAGT